MLHILRFIKGIIILLLSLGSFYLFKTLIEAQSISSGVLSIQLFFGSSYLIGWLSEQQ